MAIIKDALSRHHEDGLEQIFGTLGIITGQEIVDDADAMHKKRAPGKPKGH